MSRKDLSELVREAQEFWLHPAKHRIVDGHGVRRFRRCDWCRWLVSRIFGKGK